MAEIIRRLFRDLFRLVKDKSGLYDRLDALEARCYSLEENQKRMQAVIRSQSDELRRLRRDI